MDPANLNYMPTHEWAHLDGDLVTVGISQFAVDQLTDIVYLELPEVGATTTAGEPFGEIESVKAVSELNAPVTGEVIERNEALIGDPTQVSASPYEAGWMLKIRATDTAGLDRALTLPEYEELCAQEEH